MLSRFVPFFSVQPVLNMNMFEKKKSVLLMVPEARQ